MPTLSLLGAVYDGSAVTVSWQPWVANPVTLYSVHVVSSAGPGAWNVVKNVTSFTTSAIVPIPVALGTGATVTVTAFSGTITVATGTAALMATLPVYLSVRYDVTALTISATWQPAGTAFDYTSMALYDGPTLVAEQLYNSVATNGVLNLPRPLAQDADYLLVVTAQTSGVAGTAAVTRLITTVPQLLSAEYTGGAVVARWAAPDTTALPVTSWTIRVWNRGGGTIASATINTPTATSGSVTINNPLPAANDVLCEVSANAPANTQQGVVICASPPAQLPNATPAVLTAVYNGLAVSSTFTPVGSTATTIPIASYLLRVTSAVTGATYTAAINNAAPTNGVLPLSLPLAAADEYTFSVVALTAGAGRSSNSVPVIDQQPVVLSTSYQTSAIAVTWSPVTAPAVALTGYSIRLYTAAGQPITNTTISQPSATSGSLTLANPLPAGVRYVVQVATVSSTLAVQAASPSMPVMNVAAAVANVAYDGNVITATWSTGALPLPVASYTLVAYAPGGGVVASTAISNPSATSGVLSAPGLASGSTFEVITNAAATIAGRSAATAVPVSLPGLLSATYDGATVAAEWTVSGATGITTYTIQILSAALQVVASTLVNNPEGTAGSVTLPGPLPSSEPSFLRICANGTGIQACTPLIPLVIDVPVLTAVVVDSTQVTAAWQPILGDYAGLTAIDLLITDGSGVVRFRQSMSPAARSGSVTVAFVEGQTYTARLNPIAQKAGSLGPAFPLLLVAPSISHAAYDGATLGLTITASSEDGVTGYAWSVASSGGVVANGAVAGTVNGSVVATTSFSAAPSSAYTAAVRATAGIVAGPAGSLSLVTGAPTVNDVSISGTVVVVAWNAPESTAGITGYIASMDAGDLAVASAQSESAETLTANINIPSSLPFEATAFTVRVCATGNNTIGPWSGAAPVIGATPRFDSIVYDGTNVVASWLPIALPGVSGYIAIAGGTTTPTSTSGVTIPLTTSNATEPITIQAIGPLVKGPTGSGTVLAETLAITNAAYDGTALSLTWGAATAASAYVVELLESNAVIASQPADTPAATFVGVSLSPRGTYSARVRPAGTGSIGRPGTPLTIVTAVPIVTGLTYDGTHTTLTVTWNAAETSLLAGVNGYSVQRYVNGEPAGEAIPVAGAQTDHTDITVTLQAGQSYTVTVQATGTSAAGPLSLPRAAVATVPAIDFASYDGTNVLVSWSAPEDPNVTGYTAMLIDNDGNVVGDDQVETAGTTASFPLTTEQGKTYFVRVLAQGGVGTGAWSANVPVLIETMTAGPATNSGSFLELQWTAATETVTGYSVQLYGGNDLIAVQETKGAGATSLRLYQPLDPNGTYTATILPLNGVSRGRESNVVALIAAVPTVTELAYDGAKVTVAWNAAVMAARAGVGGYSVQLYQNGTPLGAAVPISDKTTGTADLPLSAPSAWSRYTVTVQATGTSTTGPLSDSAGVIVSRPAITAASITGYGWSLTWQPAAEEFVTGYLVTVKDASGGNALTFHTTGTSLELPNTFTNNQSQATVTAIGVNVTGAAGAAASLYGAGSSYYFSASDPYVFRAAAQPPGPAAITLYLPDVFTSAPSIQSNVFVLTKPETSSDYPYLITIAQDSVAWKFDPASRAALWTAYIQFLSDLDADVSGTPLLRPGAFNLLSQMLARALPLLFGEVLAYTYRFDAPSGYIDLVPGMRVRIDSEARQYVGPPSTSTTNLNGFVSSGTTRFDMGEYWQGGLLNAGFNSFLSLAGRPTVPAPAVSGGAAGGFDFYPALNRLPLFRLLFPAQVPPTNSFGYADMTDTVVIIGAGYFADLEGATLQYVANGNFTGWESKIFATWFRGRTVITPELPVLINGSLEYVAAGTTVRQLLSMFGGGAYPAGSYAGGLRLERAVNNIVDSIASPVPPAAVRTNTVRIAGAPLQPYSGGLDVLDLPLLQGDSVTFAPGAAE